MNFTNLKNFMDDMTRKFVPGNAASVYYHNREVFRYASGYADREHGVQMTGDELMFMYSCTKPATVVAAMQLLEKGKFLLSDPVEAYMPSFGDMTYTDSEGHVERVKHPMTIWNLFTMTSGLSYRPIPETLKIAHELTHGQMNTVDVINVLAREPLEFDPGTHWQYGRSHDALAALVETVSGMPFGRYVIQNVLEPLGIRDAHFRLTPDIEKRMACQYERRSEGVSITDIVRAQQYGSPTGGTVENCGKKNELVYGPAYDSGGAGLIISVAEYARFASALANGGVGPNGERILARSTIDLMRRNQLSPELMKDFNFPHLRGYGYGLGIRTCIDPSAASSIGSVGEIGWGGAAGATIMADPAREISVFYAHHMLNPMEDYYQPRLRNVVYSCFGE